MNMLISYIRYTDLYLNAVVESVMLNTTPESLKAAPNFEIEDAIRKANPDLLPDDEIKVIK